MPIKRLKLSPAQSYLLYKHISENKEAYSYLSKVDITQRVNQYLRFRVSHHSVVKALEFFNISKNCKNELSFPEEVSCKMGVIFKNIALLYHELAIPVPEEIRKFLN